MSIITVNCGSSSLKMDAFDVNERRIARGSVEKIGEEGTHLVLKSDLGVVEKTLPIGDHSDAFAAVAEELVGEGRPISSAADVAAVGHRVVHGGSSFSASAIITDEIKNKIKELSGLAPLHNPVNLAGIIGAQKLFPNVPHVAVFDTAFHHTLPQAAYTYGLPYEHAQKEDIRRYGFHGTSHKFVANEASAILGKPIEDLKIISCHLGNGASLCAIDGGRSVDTSMGLTPSEGLLMGTRSGDVDPGILIHLMRKGMSVDELDTLINKKSGLLGLSGMSNDLRVIEKAMSEGNGRAQLAFDVFCRQVRKYIGAYTAVMGGLDAIIFTGGIGQGYPLVRSAVCKDLEYLGIKFDEKRNIDARGFVEASVLSSGDSAVKVLVIPTNEELAIAREAESFLVD